MKEEWKAEELLATSEEIREAVMPKSITPEMVGRVLCGLVNAMENVAAHREDVAVYPFQGIVDAPEGTAWEGLGAGAVVFCNGSAAFIRKEADGGCCFAGEDYNEGTEKTGYYARTDRFYRCGAELYKAEEDSLVRLIGEWDLSEKTQELRREIVGLWDETAKIQAKLADLHSTETENLLRRLGYGEEDIEEYIWAVSHLDLDISLEDLRKSVAAWEAGEDWDQKVAPKWTEEMEAGEETPWSLRYKRFVRAAYYPHITTGKGFWELGYPIGRRIAYVGGIHATSPTEVVINASFGGTGMGTFTGQITRFIVQGNFCPCLKLLKSDIPIDLLNAFNGQPYVDLANVHVDNATNMFGFAEWIGEPGIASSVPSGLSEATATMTNAFTGRKFVGESIDINKPIESCAGIFGDRTHYCVFEDCDIDLSQSTPRGHQQAGLGYFGYLVAPEYTKSRFVAHGFKEIWPYSLVSPYAFPNKYNSCGVWEVDCPDAETFEGSYCPGAVSATFWNIGANLKTQIIKLRDFMRSYHGYRSDGTVDFYGLMGHTEILRESFRNSLRTWVSPPEPCTVVLYTEEYDVLSDEDIADLTQKGYTIVVDDSITSTPRATFKLQ